MSIKEKTIVIDISTKFYNKLRYKKGESGQNINIKIQNNGQNVDMTGVTVNVFFKKPNGVIMEKSAPVREGKATLTLSKGVLDTAGEVKAELFMTKGDELAISFTIMIIVEDSINANEAVEDKEQWDSIKDLLIKANNIVMIDDNNISNKTVFSSNKVNSHLKEFQREINSRIEEIENDGVSASTVETKVTNVINEKISDGTIANLTIGDNSITYSKLAKDVKDKVTVVTDVQTITETIDTLTGQSPANYVSYTNSCGYPLDKDVELTKLTVPAKSGKTVQFMIHSVERVYPDNPSNLTSTYTKVKDLGEVVADGNNIAELVLESTVTLPAGHIVIAHCPDGKYLGYISSTGNDGEVYAYNKDSSSIESFTVQPVKAETVTPRPLYKLEYQIYSTAETKDLKEVVMDMKATIDVIDNNKEIIDRHTLQIDTINSKLANINLDNQAAETGTRKTEVNKYFTLTVDDLTRAALDIAGTLLENGIRPAFGIRMDTVPTSITWEELRQMQTLGFELAFHGMTHSDFQSGSAPTKDDVMAQQIKTFKELCEKNGVYIKGYLGPNHYQLPVSCFKEFEWARSAYGLPTYGGSNHMSTTYANTVVMSMEITSDTQDLTTFKSWSENVLDNQYLTPMCHTQNLVAHIDKYLEVFNKWKEDGLVCLRPCDAVRQSLWEYGSIGQNSTFEIQAGTATSNYFVVAKNGNIKTNQIS